MLSVQSSPVPTVLFILFLIFSIPVSAATFTVTNLNDSGPGSLRQAISDVNDAAEDNIIVFQSGLSGNLLTEGNFSIYNNLELIGPGASVLTLFSSTSSLIKNPIFIVGKGVTLTLSGLTLSSGGNDGIDNEGTLTVNNSVISSNNYFGISNYKGILTVNNSVISNNGNTGIYNTDGTATVSNSALSGNNGGAIESDGILIVRNSALSNNRKSSGGGGIFSSGSMLTVTNTTLSGNTAGIYCGGGIQVMAQSNLPAAPIVILQNNTLSGNKAQTGGGLCIGGGGSGINFGVNMVNSNLSGNTASAEGGGIYLYRSKTLSIGNSLVAGNIAPTGKEVMAYGAFTSLGNNLFGESGISGLVAANLINSDKILPGLISTAIGPLADNGGPTLTNLPVVGSLMIDAGNNLLIPQGVTTDQRGQPRIVGGTVDIGAVEVGSVATSFTVTATAGTNGAISPATQTVNSGDTTNFTVTPNIGYSIQAVTGCGGTLSGTTYTTGPITGNCTVNATFSASTFALTVTKTGTSTGTVTSSPAGINCGTACTATFANTATVTLTAAATTGSTFAGWSGACSGTGACSVPMSAAKTVTATFNTTPTFALTVTKVGTGTGAVSSNPAGINCGNTCSALFSGNVTLTASATTGSTFAGWSGACTNATGACSVSMTAAKSVTATFNSTTPTTYTLTVTKAGTGSGTVASSPAGINCGTTCTANFASTATVTLTATADTGSTFANWSGACSGTGACSVAMSAAKSVTATFATSSNSEVFPLNGVWPTGWTTPTTSNAAWTVMNTDPAQEGSYSLRSGAISDNQKSQVEISGNFQAGAVSFARRVSSESSYDFLRFSIDGVIQGQWSGEQAWSVVSYPLTAGAHTLRWAYEKDVSLSKGSDAAWIDAVSLPATGGGTATGHLVVLQADSPSVVTGGPGDDLYLLTPHLLTGSEVFTLSDAQGDNRLQLVSGLAIAASEVTATTLQLTLSNGTQLKVNGANAFSYQPCGNAVIGLNPTPVTFASFALDALGVAIPSSGTASGGAVTIKCS